jgi:hypothetical protein
MSGGGGAGGAGGAGGEPVFTTTSTSTGTGEGGGPCVFMGIETCDNIDNDCNDITDDIPGLDLTSPVTCGTCSNNCNAKLLNCDLMEIECGKSPDPGKVPGECSCKKCVDDYFDLDGDGSCEYYCVQSATDDATCNNQDDDCDNLKDEDVDLCTSTENCGKCGAACVVLHGTPECVHTGSDPCDPSNTKCGIKECTCTGPDDCYYDLDGQPGTGCEYKCYPSNGGKEICGDGVDNDCDGKIDGADSLVDDPTIGSPCYGDPDGVCATAMYAGAYACVGNQVVCLGAAVLHEGDLAETCNGKDDDCDGVVDDNPAMVGNACGTSNLAPCKFGKLECQGGSLVCAGALNPQTEVCDGLDNDCDGVIDLTQATMLPPADSLGPCDIPKAPPPGATSPCKSGAKSCVGGVIACQGSVGPSSQVDACGVDANCDGLLTNQPDLQTDVSNCGACGNDCYKDAVHASWGCQAGACVFLGCESGYYDILGNDNKCEYACISNPPEVCNNNDDDCDGQVDEGVIGVPSPTQACGVSPAAMSAECTSGVSVACVGGAWKCTFPAGVCGPSCDDAVEVCDALDNNCDGALNENAPTFGKPCASDDAEPVPGHGACRTVGAFVCDGANQVKCSASKADCSSLPGGCAEKCDGVDNDCDGTIDETYLSKGNNPAFFVKPTVTKINNSPAAWIFTYEASRPNAGCADPASNDPQCKSPGSGNGYHTVAPTGETLDKTLACSDPDTVPWFNVSPVEVEQTCKAIGGTICPNTAWQASCKAGVNCLWGYNPNDASCTTPAVGTNTNGGTKFCNLGPTFDSDTLVANDQDGLLPTASPDLKQCFGDWDAPALGNVGSAAKLFDITGNLREVTRCQVDRAVCGTTVDIAACALNCCSATSTAVTGGVRLCGALTVTPNQRLSGQPCTTDTMCCGVDSGCTGTGVCKADVSGQLFCTNTPAPATACRARGVACSQDSQCCGSSTCAGGFCGGAGSLPHSTFPLMGGSFVTQTEEGARCDFSFYSVDPSFKFFDTGFRCCFSTDPTL